MSFSSQKVEFEALGVAMGADTTSDMGTLEEGRRLYPEALTVVVTAAPSGSGQCNLSIGTNAPDYNNIVNSLNVNGAGSGVEKFYFGDLSAHGGWTASVNSGAPIKAKVTKTSTLSGGTMHVVINGFYYP